MKIRIPVPVIGALCLVVVTIGGAISDSTVDYMGQTRPGLEPRIFAEGVISTSARELNSVFSPDGSLFLFTRRDDTDTYRIMETRNGPGGWSSPSVTRSILRLPSSVRR
jgi:hypothetical protein